MIISAKQIKEAIIIVSTDSKIIQGYADKHKVHSLYSDRKFLNGTERCFYTAKKFKAQKNDIVVNLQADEFNINMAPIKSLLIKLKIQNLSLLQLWYTSPAIKLSILIKIM